MEQVIEFIEKIDVELVMWTIEELIVAIKFMNYSIMACLIGLFFAYLLNDVMRSPK